MHRVRAVWFAAFWIGLVADSAGGQSFIIVRPAFGDVSGTVYGNFSSGATFGIAAFGPDNLPTNVKFTCDTIPPGEITLLIVSPCNGTTPQNIEVRLNPDTVRYAVPNTHKASVTFHTVDQSPPRSDGFTITVTLLAPGDPFFIGGIVSAASLQPTISPGEVVSIFGGSLGPPLLSSQPDAKGFYPTLFGNTTVTFNGIPAAVLFNNTAQVNAVVPYGLAGQKTAQVVVSHYGQVPKTFSFPMADTAPGIFTLTQDGRGQGAILNAGATVTVNGTTNPAPKGSIIVLYATGAGLWNQTIPDGLVLTNVLQPPIIPKAAVSLTIGGQPAQILYAGAAPYMGSGVVQVNAIVPDGIGSGPQPIVLTIGQNGNAQQNVTVAVQ